MDYVKRTQILNEARNYIGVRWKHQERGNGAIDCAGLVINVGKSLNFLSPDFEIKDYQRHSCGYDFLNHFRSHMREKSVTDAEIGDVMLFKDDIYPCHSGIIGVDKRKNLTVIHACAKMKKVLEEKITDRDLMIKRCGCFEFIER